MTTNIPSLTTSDFYYACRNGDTAYVREHLPNMTLDEINQVQANGSTALHAACFYGHEEIVQMLLDKGASRSVSNRHKCLPYDEAKTDEIKKMFLRRSATRFADDGSGHIDWMKCDGDAEKIAREYRIRHKGLSWEGKVDHRMEHIKSEMLSADEENVRLFLEQAQADPFFLLKAYTVESPFYRKLNQELAMKYYNHGSNFGITYFIDFFYNNPAFDDLSYTGKVYRGMVITKDDLKQYQIGGKVMSKAFMSTTLDRSIAKDFAKNGISKRKTQPGELVKISTFCSYEIVNRRTGLRIASLSEYQHEQEVLVGPYSAFIIIDIRHIQTDYVEIDLREIEQTMKDSDDDNDDDDYD